jgi:ubiquinone/menaquinone biosynthesis C-methylase UbiE
MTTNVERFTGRVADYERYRLRYPADAILPILKEWCGLTPQGIIADIGAGTGMLSEVFLKNANEVIAVEPNAEMRALCTKLSEQWPRLSVVNATAEETGLPDASVELISVGRAFHWFDQERALAEFRRILKPGGWVALVSAGRAKDGTPQSEAYEQLLVKYGTDSGYVRGGHRIHERMDGLFAGGELRRTKITGEQRLSWDEFSGQTMSFSVTPLPGHPKHADMMRALEEFFARFASDGKVTFFTTCWVTCGRFPAALKKPSTASTPKC